MIIDVNGLWKRYGRFEALQGLQFSVPDGSAFALVGANGAGKTTTIKILMNLLTPSRGHAIVLGRDSRSIAQAELRPIGYVSENQLLPARLTVAAYLDFLRPCYPTWDRALEDAMLRDMQLPPRRKIRDLSHGMRIKLALIAALAFHPRLLILDEPFAGLDALVRDELLDRLRRQAGEMTIFISSHELNETEGLATHIGLLAAGRLIVQESLDALTARCREVSVTVDGTARVPDPRPLHWLQPRTAGNVLMFTDTRFSSLATDTLVRTLCGGVQHIETRPMSLRAIFTTLAPAARDGAFTE
jgi:ABC-2 type transport system ATP-binding protein